MPGLLPSIVALLACAPPPAEVAASAPEAPPPSTVVMFVGCTLRADRLGAYGNERDTTPYLDALAEHGASFARVLSNAPWTRPGVGALVTGRHPLELGIDDNGDDVDFARGIAPEWSTLAERFAAAGWTAVGATANPNANARFGFAQGFTTYLDTSTRWAEIFEKVPSTAIVDAWLESAAAVEGPLYGQLVVVDTHRPLGWLAQRRLRLRLFPLGEDLVDQYDAALTAVDDALRRLDEGLARLGRGDRLLVVVGDHGEGLRQPRWAGRSHATRLFDANLRVPWILHGSGVSSGVVVDGLAQSLDVAPTVMGLAGLPPDPDLPGRDLALAVRRGWPEVSWPEVLSTTRYGRTHKTRLTTRGWSFVRVYEPGRRRGRGDRQLYAATDERQARDVASDHPDVARDLEARLSSMAADYESRALVWSSAATPGELEQLRALGYFEDQDDAD